MDILLAVALGLIQLALAGLGVYVSLRPPASERHSRYIVTFVIIGMLGIGVNIGQRHLNNQIQEELRTRLTRIEGSSSKIEQGIAKAQKPPTIVNRITVSPSPPDRRIPPAKRDAIVRMLARHRAEAYVGALSTDDEAWELGADILGVLRDAKWSLPGGKVGEMIGRMDPGITVESYGEPHESAAESESVQDNAAIALVRAMNQINIEATAVIGREKGLRPGKFLRVMIGQRPR